MLAKTRLLVVVALAAFVGQAFSVGCAGRAPGPTKVRAVQVTYYYLPG